MKTIIIPVKFNGENADLLKNIIPLCGKEETNVIFLDIRKVPDAYGDLLTLPKIELPKKTTEIYKKYAETLNKTYDTSISVSADFLYGDSPAVFRNYVDFKDASLVVYAESEWSLKKNMNIFRMIKRCGCELMYIASEVPANNEAVQYTLNKDYKHSKGVPDTVFEQFNAVDHLLHKMHQQYVEHKIISRKYSNLSRYFLKEASIQEMLQKSNCSMVLIQK